MSKKILVVYPHNLHGDKHGINSRLDSLLTYFKDRELVIDLFTLKNFKSSCSTGTTSEPSSIRRIFFYDFQEGQKGEKWRDKKRNPLRWLHRFLPGVPLAYHLPNFAYKSMRQQLLNILARETYDFIMISYAYWADLIKNIAGDTVTVLDLSDFLSLNHYDRYDTKIRIGTMIEEEVNRVNCFDRVLCISREEMWFFSNFAPAPRYFYIPHFLEPAWKNRTPPFTYHLVFVGSDNPHNIKGLTWFFEKIYPLLDTEVRILVIGSVGRHITLPVNAAACERVDEISGCYDTCGIALCPLLTGTGMKIKVIEALAHGLPVVTTPHGVFGFPSMDKNGCIVANSPGEFARAIRLLLKDETYYRNTCREGREFFQEYFHRRKVYQALDRAFCLTEPTNP